MPIIDMQRQMTEVGRIRLGKKGEKGNPVKLETFRLTSKDKVALESAAEIYGGTVTPWEGQPGQWELFTTTDKLDVFIAPIEVSQWFELWSGGGCQRRCDGVTCQLAQNGRFVDVPCECDEDDRQCKATTRISVMLPNVKALGAWRVETHGWNAGKELPAMADLLIQQYLRTRRFVPCVLALEQREKVSHGKTKKFAVPVIRLNETLANALAGSEALGALPGPQQQPPAPIEVKDSVMQRVVQIGGSEAQYLRLCELKGQAVCHQMIANAIENGLSWNGMREAEGLAPDSDEETLL